jgi:hypothetical protein
VQELLKKWTAPGAKDIPKTIETYFVYCAVWAFGCSFSEKDGEDYRAKFSEFWKGEFKTVRIPSRETVFDYWLDPEELKFELWKQSPYFKTIDFDSRVHQMATIVVPTPETCSGAVWAPVGLWPACCGGGGRVCPAGSVLSYRGDDVGSACEWPVA